MALREAGVFALGFRDFEETWSDFQLAWDRVQYPVGSVLLQSVFETVDVADQADRLDPVVANVLRTLITSAVAL